MIRLEAHDLQWVHGFEDDPTDQCAHGRVLFEIDGVTFVKPEDGIWTLSAAGLYLLRSLRESHSAANRIAEGNSLFPCCGFFVAMIGIRFPVLCSGCPNGVDVEIAHSGDSVHLSSAAASTSLPSTAWRSAVVAFASSIRDFYLASVPKAPIADEQVCEGWEALWREWNERSAQAELQAI